MFLSSAGSGLKPGAPALSPDFPESEVDRALDDHQERVSDEFAVPNGMRSMVGFWLRIYTLYSTQQVVLYDRHHPEVIYEVVDLRPLARTARNRVVYEILAERKVKARLRAVRAALERLARREKPGAADEEMRHAGAAIARLGHAHPYPEFVANLRAQTGQRDNVMRGLFLSAAFMPQMERIFREQGLPSELTRLVLVESSFDQDAHSRAGAKGVWQFLAGSGREFLTVDEARGLDERLSPWKASVAASKLLAKNRRYLRSWPLAVTGYHHGYRGLYGLSQSGLARAGETRAFTLCGRDSPLGFASKNYYAEFLAILHAESYRDYFYGPIVGFFRPAVRFMELGAAARADRLASEQGLSWSAFKALNPDVLRERTVLPEGFWVALPAQEDRYLEMANGLRPQRRIRLLTAVR